MSCFNRHLVLFAVAWCPSGLLAKDSLFEARTARPLQIEERSLFGTKSADFHYDPRMIAAAKIALQRAKPQKTWRCWASVKDALLAAQLVSSRPTSGWAKQAGDELCRKFGFTKLSLLDPMKAPIGAVIVYGGQDAGHVELRTAKGFVSDFVSPTPYERPLVGVFVKKL